MILTSHSSGPLIGEMQVPGDKSISHRALLLGAIAIGTTTVHGFLEGEDCLATLVALQSMGVSIECLPHHVLQITGVGKHGLQAPKHTLDCGNSGTSLRLLTGLLAAQSFDVLLTGDDSLQKRPMERITRPLTQMGADIRTTNGRAPITIRGGQTLQGITYEMPEASAQVKSGILLAGLYATGETRIIEPSVTRDHTERMLAAFSYPVHKAEQFMMVNAASECIATDIQIPGDLSSAAFFIVAATLIPGSQITIKNVGINPTRTGILTILKKMGAQIVIKNKRLWGEEPVADLQVSAATLEGISIPAAWVPVAIDEFPIIFIAAAAAKGQTILQGAQELRYKESDRIQVMVKGLQQLGIEARALEDGICIQGGTLQGGVVDSAADHRVAMSFAVAGALAKGRVHIQNSQTIHTSFPNFVALAQHMQLNIEECSA